ncbi:hypothetical protein DPMN_155673 [Dreissena polymorpha]|uniref:Uncharacterized protein n=1 Tax=Dreissena polymorpha TaxID=45954 RepID=A0A9D4FU55_DREPO|nr:hypothetical protein DPMN_155673 [Dreissena polymorpha]
MVVAARISAAVVAINAIMGDVLGQTHTYKNRQTDRQAKNQHTPDHSIRFHEKDPENCDRQTDRRIERKPNFPRVKPCHEDPTINVASTVLTRQIFMTHKGRQTIEQMSSQKFTISNKFYAHKIVTIFEDDIIQTNRSALLIGFQTRKNARPPGGHAFQPTKTIFIQDIIMMNLLIKVYEDQTINVASRVFTRKNAPPPDIIGTNLLTKVLARKKAPPPLGGHVFQPTGTVFKLIKDIENNRLLPDHINVFHEDLTINVASRVLKSKNASPTGCHVFKATRTFFQTSPRYIRINIQTKFHDDLKMIVAPRVLSRKNAPPPLAAMRNAPALGSYVFQANIGNIDVAYRVLIRKNAPPHGGHVFQ